MLPATADVEKCKEVAPIANAYDKWADESGAQRADHYIVTKYKDGEENIGWHSDKKKDIAASGPHGTSLITVVKIGNCARLFGVREAPAKGQKAKEPLFCEPLQPGTAVIMTTEANLMTQHAVPKVEKAAASGSIVFRTIPTLMSMERTASELRKRPREPITKPTSKSKEPASVPPPVRQSTSDMELTITHTLDELARRKQAKAAAVKNMKVAELKEGLEKRGLDTTGKKPELAARLEGEIRSEAEWADDAASSGKRKAAPASKGKGKATKK